MSNLLDGMHATGNIQELGVKGVIRETIERRHQLEESQNICLLTLFVSKISFYL